MLPSRFYSRHVSIVKPLSRLIFRCNKVLSWPIEARSSDNDQQQEWRCGLKCWAPYACDPVCTKLTYCEPSILPALASFVLFYLRCMDNTLNSCERLLRAGQARNGVWVKVKLTKCIERGTRSEIINIVSGLSVETTPMLRHFHGIYHFCPIICGLHTLLSFSCRVMWRCMRCAINASRRDCGVDKLKQLLVPLWCLIDSASCSSSNENSLQCIKNKNISFKSKRHKRKYLNKIIFYVLTQLINSWTLAMTA